MPRLAHVATRIALIKVGALGDVVRTTALLPGLRRLFPDMELTWITSAAALPLVEGNPHIARVVIADASSDASWRQADYDWVISLDDEPSLCDLATKLKSRRLSGAHRCGNECVYTTDLEPWFGMGLMRPASQGGLERANELKHLNRSTHAEILYRCLKLPKPIARPFVRVPDEKRHRAADWVRANPLDGPLVGLNTGAGSRWRFKSWGESQTVELARSLADSLGAGVIILGGAAETERNRRIVEATNHPRVCAAPTDLDVISFAAFIDQVDVLVTSDSLGLHLGTALEKAVVVFFGPTSSSEIDIYGLGEKITTPLACRTCYLKDCNVEPNCMDSITVARILEATASQLSASHRSACA